MSRTLRSLRRARYQARPAPAPATSPHRPMLKVFGAVAMVLVGAAAGVIVPRAIEQVWPRTRTYRQSRW
jgi:hypothetical protein